MNLSLSFINNKHISLVTCILQIFVELAKRVSKKKEWNIPAEMSVKVAM